MPHYALLLVLTAAAAVLSGTCLGEDQASVYKTDRNIAYRADLDDAYAQQQCRLDVYHPVTVTDDKTTFPTVVWFHGGGLTGGKRSVPKGLQQQGIAVVAVSYRLYPKIKAPVYIQDAAAAVAWTVKNIANYGGSANLVFVSGHSAGGYLTSMIGYDKRWLAEHDIDADHLAGLIPYSGHTITHFTVRKERGIDGKQPIIDDMAPLFHVRKNAPPTLLITGDRSMEMLGRYEENAYFWRMLQVIEHPDCELFELDGYGHGAMAEPAHPLSVKFVKRISKRTPKKASESP